MKIDRKLNTLSYSDYIHLLKNHTRFTDFNSLGLFRSILENEKLTPEQRIEVRDAAISTFSKSFVFLQVKDPWTYRKLTLLGQDFTAADEDRLREIINLNQQKILAEKKIKHRNFGIYSKHSCGYDTCHLNNLMTKQGSWLADGDMYFQTDHRNKYGILAKSERYRKERKLTHRLIQADLDKSAE